jgi:hypothetical protein
MIRRPVALVAGALLLVVVTVGCSMPPPAPGVTITVTADTTGATAVLSKFPANASEHVITSCTPTCSFAQTAAEMAAAPDGYVVQIAASTDFDYFCTAGQAAKTDAFAATGVFVGFCAYSDEPPAVGIGVHNPALAPGSTTAITVDLTPAP